MSTRKVEIKKPNSKSKKIEKVMDMMSEIDSTFAKPVDFEKVKNNNDVWDKSTPYFDMAAASEEDKEDTVKVHICTPNPKEPHVVMDVNKEELISLEQVLEDERGRQIELDRINSDQYQSRLQVNNETADDIRAQIEKAEKTLAVKPKVERCLPEYITKLLDKNAKRPEMVDHPKHYNLENGPYIKIDNKKHPIECIDVIRNMPTWKGNVFKYLWRCGEKTEDGMTPQQKELEDMKKALWYLQDKINEMES